MNGMILVTGASGFLGEWVVREFVARGVYPTCFVRKTSDTKALSELRVNLRYGDLNDVDSLATALKGVRILVNIASLGFGHAPLILEACRRANVRRGIFVSTTAIFTTLEARTKSIRLEAERLIMESGMDWTIIRPTMIYGTERDRNMARLIRFLARFPVMPVFGSGENLQQPIHVEDLAKVIVAAVESEASINKAYNVAGKTPVTYNQVIDQTAAALGRKVIKIKIPASPVVGLLKLYERLVPKPILKAEQVLRLNEDKAFSYDEATRDLGFHPRSFADGIRLEVERMKAKGLI